MTTLTEWLNWIEQQHPKAIDLSLDRVRRAAEILNVLHFECPVITVGGTNGKGSTVATLAAIYTAAGYRCGVYTSPHLLHHNERIVIAGEKVKDADLCAAFEAIEKAKGSISLTYFEYSTLAALYCFQRSHLDVIILEVGLGGRLDAVNIVDSDVAILTTVDLDHTDYLGDTREAIGREKAGIFRADKPAIYGDAPPVSTVLSSAKDKGAHLLLAAHDFHYQENDVDWQWENKAVHYSHLPKPKIVLSNAALALEAIDGLQAKLPVDIDAISQGLKTVCAPARFQCIAENPKILIDVAHNPQASRNLHQQLTHLGWQGRLHIVFSHLPKKDGLGTLLPWQGCEASWYLAPLNVENATPLDQILANFDSLGITPYQKYGTIEGAYRAAQQNAKPEETILVFGSFHTVAAVMQIQENMRCLLP